MNSSWNRKPALKLFRHLGAIHAFWFAAILIAYGQGRLFAQSADGAEQFADLGDFHLRGGAIIHDFRLGYRTLGKLNADRSNAVLWPSWLGGKTDDLLQYVGTANVVDTEKYFVVLVDGIGNGISTSPSNSKSQPRMKFPEFTIRDMIESEHRLLTEVLHISHLHAVVGVSMGGMQTFEWILAYPDFADLAIPMFGSPQSTAYDKLLWTAQIDALELDPAWNNGNPAGPMKRGFELFAEIGSMNVSTPDYRVAQTKPADFNSFLAEVRKGSQGDAGTASDQIRQRQAIISLDIPAEFGITMEEAARRARAKLLVVVSPQDHMVNPAPAVRFAEAIGAPVILLDSSCGHLSISCISIGPIVAKFLADPSSVHGMTLRNPGHD